MFGLLKLRARRWATLERAVRAGVGSRAGRPCHLVEALEGRRLLTSAVDGNGVLVVDGTAAADTISFVFNLGQLTVNVNGVDEGTFDPATLTGLQVNGLGGADSLYLADVPINSEVNGGAGDDTITGGLGSDTLNGDDGDDSFVSNDGFADTVDGGLGTDTVVADNTLDTFLSIENGIVLPVAHVEVKLGGVAVVDGATTPVDFGTVNLGGTGPTRTFTVTNSGTADLSLGALQLPAGYAIVDDLVTTLAVGASDTFTIRLTTAGTGTFAGEISFANTDPTQNPFHFAITGTVVVPTAPIVVVTQARPSGNIDNGNSTVEFGNRAVSTTGPTRTFRVRNDGTAALNLGTVIAPAGFTIIDPLASVLAPGASESFVVQVDTSGVGVKDGFVTFTTDDPIRGNFSFRVQANVLAVAAPSPEITVKSVQAKGNLRGVLAGESAFTFGTVDKGATRPTRTFRVSNDGDAALTLGAISVPAGFVILDNLPATMASGAIDFLVIGMDTSAVANRSGNVTFTTNDSDENPFSFAVSGIVQTPPAPPAPGTGPVPTATLANGVLTVGGTPGIDTIQIGQSSRGITVVANSKTLNTSPFKGVGRIVIYGGDGSDRIVVGEGVTVATSVIGGNGNDTIIGGDAADTLFGNDGDDSLDGGLGNDQLWGGLGNDTITGGLGVDLIHGEDGNDVIYGADGIADTLLDGGNGTDVIHKDRTDNAVS